MRILLVGSYYYPATCFGGPVWVLKDLARGLAERGLHVEVLTTSANEPEDDPPRTDAVDGVTIRYDRRVTRSSYYFSPGLTRSLLKTVKRFDILHIHGVWTYSTAMACAVAQIARKPYVLAPHGCFDPWALAHRGLKKRLYLALIEKRNLRRAAAVHCLTQREKNQVLRLVPEARCEVIPNAVTIDPSALTPMGRTDFAGRFAQLSGKKIVLFLSRVHQKKGLDLLVPAFVRVRASLPNAHLVIAGPDEGGYMAQVEKLVLKHKLRGDVTFTGLLNGQDRLAAFDSADIFVLPSYSEGLPVVVLEAMAMGKPVVITDPCNLTDEVHGAGAGLVVDSTANAIAEGILLLLRDPTQARIMGESARNLAQERFSLDAVTSRLVEVFQEALANSRKRDWPETGDV